MYKKIFPLGFAALFALASCQQEAGVTLTQQESADWKQAVASPQANAQDIRLYTQGKRLGDAAVMYGALHNMLARDPGNDALKDSLASMYFRGRMYGQTVTLTKELLEDKPDDTRYLEMEAVSQNSLGLLEEALASYGKLLKADPNPYYAYQIATLQYGLNRYELAEASVDNMLAADLSKERVNINIAQGRSQTVPMKAALLNIKGVLRKDVHSNVKQAREYFELAMAESPDFLLARNNLKSLDEAKAVN